MQWPFKAWGASAVIAGHDHDYERIIRNGFPYFVDGTGGNTIHNGFVTPVAGSRMRSDSDYGAIIVAANETTLTFRYNTTTGEIIDVFQLQTPVKKAAIVRWGTTPISAPLTSD